jgi:hypothetical protein
MEGPLRRLDGALSYFVVVEACPTDLLIGPASLALSSGEDSFSCSSSAVLEGSARGWSYSYYSAGKDPHNQSGNQPETRANTCHKLLR